MNKLLLVILAISAFLLQDCAAISGVSNSSNSISQSSNSLSQSSDSSQSLSKSLASISQSISSISASSSKEDKKKEAAYMMDVRDTTALYFANHFPTEKLWNDIDEIAARHGIAQWKGQISTYTAIGEGLKKAGVSEYQVQELLDTKIRPEIIRAIHEGYKSA